MCSVLHPSPILHSLFQSDDLKRAVRELDMEEEDDDFEYLARRVNDEGKHKERQTTDPPAKPHFVVMLIDDLGKNFYHYSPLTHSDWGRMFKSLLDYN